MIFRYIFFFNNNLLLRSAVIIYVLRYVALNKLEERPTQHTQQESNVNLVKESGKKFGFNEKIGNFSY